MIDQLQSRTIPIQSWAMVLAALITNLGVVIAAFIQSGWIEKPYSASFPAQKPYPVNSQASEAGAIDPPNETGFNISQPAAANTPAYLTGATQGSVHVPAADARERVYLGIMLVAVLAFVCAVSMWAVVPK
jgi:hypothetical protein